MPRTNETRHIKWYKTCNCRVRLDVIIFSNVATKINVVVNIKYWLTKEDVIKKWFGILVIVNVNVMNHVTQDSFQVK